MTREEALESGIRQAWRHFVSIDDVGFHNPEWAARDLLCEVYPNEWKPDELDGFAVGLQLIAVEVAEIARKRREAAAHGQAVPYTETFTHERVEVAGPAGDPVWTYERRREAE